MGSEHSDRNGRQSPAGAHDGAVDQAGQQVVGAAAHVVIEAPGSYSEDPRAPGTNMRARPEDGVHPAPRPMAPNVVQNYLGAKQSIIKATLIEAYNLESPDHVVRTEALVNIVKAIDKAAKHKSSVVDLNTSSELIHSIFHRNGASYIAAWQPVNVLNTTPEVAGYILQLMPDLMYKAVHGKYPDGRGPAFHGVLDGHTPITPLTPEELQSVYTRLGKNQDEPLLDLTKLQTLSAISSAGEESVGYKSVKSTYNFLRAGWGAPLWGAFVAGATLNGGLEGGLASYVTTTTTYYPAPDPSNPGYIPPPVQTMQTDLNPALRDQHSLAPVIGNAVTGAALIGGVAGMAVMALGTLAVNTIRHMREPAVLVHNPLDPDVINPQPSAITYNIDAISLEQAATAAARVVVADPVGHEAIVVAQPAAFGPVTEAVVASRNGRSTSIEAGTGGVHAAAGLASRHSGGSEAGEVGGDTRLAAIPAQRSR